MQVARERGHLKGKKPKLTVAQQKVVMELHQAGSHTTAELAGLFNVGRSTIYRTYERHHIPSELADDSMERDVAGRVP